MKKFTSLLITCSLTLAGAAFAQQPDEQPSPKPKEAAEKAKGHAPEVKPEAPSVAKPAVPAAEKHVPAEHKPVKAEMTKAPDAPKVVKPEAAPAKPHVAEEAPMAPKPEATPINAPEVSSQPAATVAPEGKKHAEKGKKAMKPIEAAKTSHTPAAASVTPMPKAMASATPAPTVASSPAQAPTIQPKAGTAAVAKKPDPKKVEQIKAEHASFHAQPKPEQVPAVTFNQEYRIQGSDQWQGQQYEVFRSYHPERHDETYYRSHYTRVELISGGYYYQNNGYWYPAWGYKPSDEYYAYDGPIYVGHRAEPPDRVIADVQGVLQDMGYYKGEVDGLLGPLTRHALTAYQADQGLTPTAAIDEPTINALGMG